MSLLAKTWYSAEEKIKFDVGDAGDREEYKGAGGKSDGPLRASAYLSGGLS
jgi:hypothetical protein